MESGSRQNQSEKHALLPQEISQYPSIHRDTEHGASLS